MHSIQNKINSSESKIFSDTKTKILIEFISKNQKLISDNNRFIFQSFFNSEYGHVKKVLFMNLNADKFAKALKRSVPLSQSEEEAVMSFINNNVKDSEYIEPGVFNNKIYNHNLVTDTPDKDYLPLAFTY